MVRGKRLAVVAGGLGVVAAGCVVLLVAVLAVVVVFGGTGDDAPAATAADQRCRRPAPAVPVLEGGARVTTLTAEQTGHARTVVQVAVSLSASRGLGPAQTRQAAVIGLMTALQESTLRNLDYGDRDSLGLFQQRPSQGWGTPEQVQDPVYAAGQFYDRLVRVPAWDSGRLTEVAQAVQRSGYPELYQRWQEFAQSLTVALRSDDFRRDCG